MKKNIYLIVPSIVLISMIIWTSNLLAQNYTLTVNSNQSGVSIYINGTLTVLPTSLVYSSGTQVQVLSHTQSGLTWDHWVLQGTNYTSDPFSFFMYSNKTLTAYYNTSTCNVPTGLSCTNSTQTSITLTWNPATGANGYYIYYKHHNVSSWEYSFYWTSPSSQPMVTQLTCGTQYDFEIKSDCGGSMSNFSPSITCSTASCPPVCNPPTGLNCNSSTQNSVSISWNSVSEATSGYIVQYRQQGTSSWSAYTTGYTNYTFSGLNPSTQYEFQVESNCGGSQSSWSSSLYCSTTASCTSPSATVNNNSGIGSTTLTCNASGGSGGSINYEWHGGTSCSGAILGTSSTYTTSVSGYFSCNAYISGYQSTCYDCEYGYATVNSPYGSLQVNLNPSNAQWNVDGGPWQNSGTTVSGITVGNHNVYFSNVDCYTTPSYQPVTITSGNTATWSQNYLTANININVSSSQMIYSVNQPIILTLTLIDLNSGQPVAGMQIGVEDPITQQSTLTSPTNINGVTTYTISSTNKVGYYSFYFSACSASINYNLAVIDQVMELYSAPFPSIALSLGMMTNFSEAQINNIFFQTAGEAGSSGGTIFSVLLCGGAWTAGLAGAFETGGMSLEAAALVTGETCSVAAGVVFSNTLQSGIKNTLNTWVDNSPQITDKVAAHNLINATDFTITMVIGAKGVYELAGMGSNKIAGALFSAERTGTLNQQAASVIDNFANILDMATTATSINVTQVVTNQNTLAIGCALGTANPFETNLCFLELYTPNQYLINCPPQAFIGDSVTINYMGLVDDSANYQWQWDGGNVNLGMGVGPYSITWNTLGLKTIQCIISSAKKSIPDTLTTTLDIQAIITGTSSAENTSLTPVIFPNPTTGLVSLDTTVIIQIFDNLGKFIKTIAVEKNKSFSLDLPAGIYLIKYPNYRIGQLIIYK